jgi:hypothetical protein
MFLSVRHVTFARRRGFVQRPKKKILPTSSLQTNVSLEKKNPKAGGQEVWIWREGVR